MKFQFIRDHREHFPVRLMCRVLEASPLTIHQFSMLPIEEVRAGRPGGF